MEVSLLQTMLQKLIDLFKLESFRPHQEIAIQSIIQDQKDAVICTNIDCHNQHESTALIGPFHATALVLTSVESYRNYRKPTQRGVQGYLSSLQRRVSSLVVKLTGLIDPFHRHFCSACECSPQVDLRRGRGFHFHFFSRGQQAEVVFLWRVS